MSISLYQLTADYQHALDNITVDEETGEVIGFEEINAIDAQFDAKAVNCALYAKSLKAEAEAIKAEADVLKNRHNIALKKLDRLNQYIADCMNAAGKDKITDPRVRLSFRTSEQVVVDDMNELPEEFISTKITRTPDKTAIKQAIKMKNYLVGARLVRKQNLQIK